jgi:hypothetical protein
MQPDKEMSDDTVSQPPAIRHGGQASGEQDRFIMRDHMIFDTGTDAFVGAGDACYLLNETNAWTAEQVRELLGFVSERKQNKIYRNALLSADDENKQLREQLAAERENVRIRTEQVQYEREQKELLREQLDAAENDYLELKRGMWRRLNQANEKLVAAIEALKRASSRLHSIHDIEHEGCCGGGKGCPTLLDAKNCDAALSKIRDLTGKMDFSTTGASDPKQAGIASASGGY